MATTTMIVVALAAVVAYQVTRPKTERPWAPPDGYIVAETIAAQRSTVRLWTNKTADDVCWIVETVDSAGTHEGSVGACSRGAMPVPPSVSLALGALVGRVPDTSARAVVVRTTSGASAGPLRLHNGTFILAADLAANERQINVQALSADGMALGPEVVVEIAGG